MIRSKIYTSQNSPHKTSTDRDSEIIRSCIETTIMGQAEISTTTRKMLANAEDAG